MYRFYTYISTLDLSCYDNDGGDCGEIVPGCEDHQINVSHIVYETIYLGLPIRKFHNQETKVQICYEEVIKKLEEYQKKESNKRVDDRWLALKKILTDKD